jgi:hypothetical protein
MPDAPHLDPNYEWPTGSNNATHNDVAAAVEHLKAWFKANFGAKSAPTATPTQQAAASATYPFSPAEAEQAKADPTDAAKPTSP